MLEDHVAQPEKKSSPVGTYSTDEEVAAAWRFLESDDDHASGVSWEEKLADLGKDIKKKEKEMASKVFSTYFVRVVCNSCCSVGADEGPCFCSYPVRWAATVHHHPLLFPLLVKPAPSI